jgi:hypothetical protein
MTICTGEVKPLAACVKGLMQPPGVYKECFSWHGGGGCFQDIGRGLMLTTHPRLLPRLEVSEAVPPLTLHV